MIEKLIEKVANIKNDFERVRLLRRTADYVHMTGFYQVENKQLNENKAYKMAEEYVFGTYGNVGVFLRQKGLIT